MIIMIIMTFRPTCVVVTAVWPIKKIPTSRGIRAIPRNLPTVSRRRHRCLVVPRGGGDRRLLRDALHREFLLCEGIQRDDDVLRFVPFLLLDFVDVDRINPINGSSVGQNILSNVKNIFL